MKERIDILLSSTHPDSYPSYSAHQMKRALEKEGKEVWLLSLGGGDLQKYLAHVMDEPPMGLITFEEYLSRTINFQKLLGCPELFLAQHSFTPIAHFLGERGKRVALPDRTLARFTEGYFFISPLEEGVTIANRAREIPIACFANLISVEALRLIWRTSFSKEVAEEVERWCRVCQQEVHIHPLQQMLSVPKDSLALCSGLSRDDLYYALISYLQASYTRPLVEAFRTLPLHLFGNHCGKSWYQCFPHADTLHLHAQPPYAHRITLLEEIEILVIEQLPCIDGPPDHFFHALQKGALPLVYPTRYLIELYGKEAPIFYQNYEELVEKCHFYLAHPERRVAVVEELREVDLHALSSWNHIVRCINVL